ncbi:hypothetical protein HOI18_01480 [Candidatus Uhrbacteria bacterium]|nr:hypothetical protein [Candidatus Uhrbacteria bacterium]
MCAWTDLSDDGIKRAIREIVKTSRTDDEIKSRVAEELGCPYGLAITSLVPTDSVGRSARTIVRGLGGMIRQDGAMVMIMIHGPRGNTISP